MHIVSLLPTLLANNFITRRTSHLWSVAISCLFFSFDARLVSCFLKHIQHLLVWFLIMTCSVVHDEVCVFYHQNDGSQLAPWVCGGFHLSFYPNENSIICSHKEWVRHFASKVVTFLYDPTNPVQWHSSTSQDPAQSGIYCIHQFFCETGTTSLDQCCSLPIHIQQQYPKNKWRYQ